MRIITDPFPSDPLGARLCQIFSAPWSAIQSDRPEKGKPDWRTIKNYPLRPRSLWQKFLSASVLIGVRFDDTTTYGLIDIDRGSPHYSPAGIAKISAALETIGIVRTIPIRSSANGGIHLYIPLPAAVSTFSLATALKHCLESQGLELHPGHLETFPNVKAWSNWRAGIFSEYNAHRLPLQPGSGSCMLNSSLNPMPGQLELFFCAWDFAAGAQDLQLFSPALKFGRDKHSKRKKRRDHPVASWLADLENAISDGFTGASQTNSLLKDIGCLGRVFLDLSGDDLVSYILEKVQSLPGYNRFCRHQHEIAARCRSWASACEKYYWPMGAAPSRENMNVELNAARAEDAQQRIKAAVAELTESGGLADRVTRRAKQIVERARTSLTTLYLYKELWYPEKKPVTPEAASDPSTEPPDPPPEPETPEPADGGELQPAPPLMKGVQVKIAPKDCYSGRERGGVGGERDVIEPDPPP